MQVAGLKPNGGAFPATFRRFDRDGVSDFMQRVTTVHLSALCQAIEHQEVVRRLKIGFVRPAIPRREAESTSAEPQTCQTSSDPEATVPGFIAVADFE
ncbi:hypothetical protein GI374_07885 [Paracoccus sp. S-4012]|uniref:hypothetical protein n=1 Tax=Paracoccus sp. S-4012 TaxID=2665648 RepID=UPI0012B153FF|nr:hypothetical protein [Paracoccus sp. S-4012]MRX50370.1 hypothetical protein [Paracoccus sp. S-4012]